MIIYFLEKHRSCLDVIYVHNEPFNVIIYNKKYVLMNSTSETTKNWPFSAKLGNPHASGQLRQWLGWQNKIFVFSIILAL